MKFILLSLLALFECNNILAQTKSIKGHDKINSLKCENCIEKIDSLTKSIDGFDMVEPFFFDFHLQRRGIKFSNFLKKNKQNICYYKFQKDISEFKKYIIEFYIYNDQIIKISICPINEKICYPTLYLLIDNIFCGKIHGSIERCLSTPLDDLDIINNEELPIYFELYQLLKKSNY